jgi:hypothetical protein
MIGSELDRVLYNDVEDELFERVVTVQDDARV